AAVPVDARAARVLLVPAEAGRMNEDALIEFVTQQRWFGAKTRQVSKMTVVEHATLGEAETCLEVVLVEVGFDTGTHDTYQLLMCGDDLDAIQEPSQARELVHLMRAGS